MVLLGIGGIIAVYYYVDERSSAGDGYSVYALFEDAQGVIPKSRVVIAGIPIGHIKRVRLSGARARVDIQVRSDVKLHRDATVTLRTVSLLGEKVLVVSPGSLGEPLLRDGDQIRVAEGQASIEDAVDTIDAIATNVLAVTEQMRRAFGNDEAGQRMEDSLQNLSEALESVNRTIQINEDVISRAIANVESTTEEAGPKLITILNNIEQATERVGRVVAEGEPDVDEALDSINRSTAQLEEVLSDVRQVTDRTARGEGTIGRLTQDEALIDEVEGVAEGLNNLVGGISRLQTVIELRSEYNLIANTFKTYFSLRIVPREDRYFLIQLVDDPRGSLSVSETLVRRSPALPDEPGEFQETRITRTDSLRFSLQMAKRISFATFRFGIMESSGGLGVDLHLFEDRLELANDVFAIGEQAFPRLRVRAAFEVLTRLWVVSGVDDVLNDSSDFFMGLMLRFNDEDLKSILPFVGGLSP